MPRDRVKLPFGLKDGNLVHVSDSISGIACACVCPSCGDPLIARKGKKVAHHFAHQSGVECLHGVETALHLAAKEILSSHLRIALPPVEIRFNSYRPPIEISPERFFQLDSVTSERKVGTIVPDILAFSGSARLLIEVCVTHEVDEAKLERIRQLGISAVEIDLSSVSRSLSMDELTRAVVDETSNKKWLYNIKKQSYFEQLLKTGEIKRMVVRGLATHVDDCPEKARTRNGRHYANVDDDCIHCEFSLDVRARAEYIVCGGNRRIRTFEQLKAAIES